MTENKKWRFEIPGDPVPWSAHQGYGRNSYSKHSAAKKIHQIHLLTQKDFKGRLESPCELTFLFEMPMKGTLKPSQKKEVREGMMLSHTKRPDLTNLIKFAEDCLVGTILEDDNCVISTQARKYYSTNPKTIIYVNVLCSPYSSPSVPSSDLR